MPGRRYVATDGQVRSYNKIIEGAGRLLITAFAQKIVENDEHENPNQIQLTGTLCKAPAYRTTPFGREIADMMLAVNRAYGKSDYIPCITWGRSARFAAKLDVGDKITLTGRLQSRAYQKQMPDGSVIEKTAYEVSVIWNCWTARITPIRRRRTPRMRFTGGGAAAISGRFSETEEKSGETERSPLFCAVSVLITK